MAVSCSASWACSIAQLYVIARSSSDPSLFAMQFVPHEIIKKIFMFTYHPGYLKIKMFVISKLKQLSRSSSAKVTDKKKIKEELKEQRRISNTVNESLGAVAHEFSGKEV